MSATTDTRQPAPAGRGWLAPIRALWAHPTARIAARALYYLAILIALIVLYGKGDFSTPPFIYQGF